MTSLTIVDLQNLLNRILSPYKFVREFTNIEEQATKKLLKMVLDNSKNNKIIFTDDSKPYLKTELIENFKSDRVVDEVLKRVVTKTKDYLLSLGTPVLSVQGFEADDLIAHIVYRESEDLPITIISNDSDLFQLFGYNEELKFILTKGNVLDFNTMLDKYSIELQGDYLCKFFIDFHSLYSHNYLPKVRKGCGKVSSINLCSGGGVLDTELSPKEHEIMTINRRVVKLPYENTDTLFKLGCNIYNETVKVFKQKTLQQQDFTDEGLFHILEDLTSKTSELIYDK